MRSHSKRSQLPDQRNMASPLCCRPDKVSNHSRFRACAPGGDVARIRLAYRLLTRLHLSRRHRVVACHT